MVLELAGRDLFFARIKVGEALHVVSTGSACSQFKKASIAGYPMAGFVLITFMLKYSGTLIL